MEDGIFINQTPNDIIKKIRSYSHGEFNTEDITNEEIIKKIRMVKIFSIGI